uniref:Uncharacterized protein n=1 Tax=Meloidogyne enterolobii TaxID=390850 RepID=A0A6V7UXT1_MELEN|nr:unnamed protein product [Meloidogyne enterolobii]
MLLSLARLSRRPDTRPLYRRLLTNRRLDILHLSIVRFITLAFLPYTSSFIVTTGDVWNLKFYRLNWLDLNLKKKIIKMNVVGKVKKIGNIYNGVGGRWRSNFISEIAHTLMRNDLSLFIFGFGIGAGLELIKNHLIIGQVSFYKVFREKNVPRELEGFENDLKEREQRIESSLKRMREENMK